jgi:hypothetical protein
MNCDCRRKCFLGGGIGKGRTVCDRLQLVILFGLQFEIEFKSGSQIVIDMDAVSVQRSMASQEC